MLKPEQLRAALLNAIPLLQQNPERLRLGIVNGRVVSTLAPRCPSNIAISSIWRWMGRQLTMTGSWSPYWPGCAATNQTFLPIRISVKMIFRFKEI